MATSRIVISQQHARACLRSACAGSRPLCASVRPRRSVAVRAEGKEPVAQQQVDLDEQVEMFMKRQAELESGAAFARTKDPEQVIGSDLVDEEEARRLCREVIRFLKVLKTTRDMSVNEARLIVAIEDPRSRERRAIGIEDERGVSRDEMAVALLDVAEGRVPKDRLALKCLYEDMMGWPYLEAAMASSSGAPAAGADAVAGPAAAASAAPVSSTSGTGQSDYAALADAGGIVRPYIMGKQARAGDKPQSLTDMLPDWVGYGALYGISAIPLMLAGGAVLVLFFSSLR